MCAGIFILQALLVPVNQRRSLSDDSHKETLRRRSSDISSGHDKSLRQRKSRSGQEVIIVFTDTTIS